MNGFNTKPLIVTNTNAVAGGRDWALITADISLYNPSFVSLNLTVLPLLIEYNGLILGNSSATNITIKGFDANVLHANQLLRNSYSTVHAGNYLVSTSEEVQASIEDFLSSYANGLNTTFRVIGEPSAMPIQVLRPVSIFSIAFADSVRHSPPSI